MTTTARGRGSGPTKRAGTIRDSRRRFYRVNPQTNEGDTSIMKPAFRSYAFCLVRPRTRAVTDSFVKQLLILGMVLSAACLESPAGDRLSADEPEGLPSLASATYKNPLITRQNPADPHVLEVDGVYYLYPTSHGRGYDAYTSVNLVEWEHRGAVFDSATGGAWAPDVFHADQEDGKFYLYYTENHPGRPKHPANKHIGVAVADNPLGPFVDQASLVSDAIDAHLFRDDDGALYLYYANLKGGFEIRVQPMADPLTKKGGFVTLLKPTEPWERHGFPVTEAPFVLKRNRVYYLMYSGSAADNPNYGIGYATARSPTGPFVKHPGNPIVRRTEKIFGPGHHAVVTGPDGALWMVYHQKEEAAPNYRRFIALDPLRFDEEGAIHVKLSRGESRPGPRAKQTD